MEVGTFSLPERVPLHSENTQPKLIYTFLSSRLYWRRAVLLSWAQRHVRHIFS